MEERRESRIPRAPVPLRALSDKVCCTTAAFSALCTDLTPYSSQTMNTQTDRKRKAVGMDSITEAKRAQTAPFSSRPARSMPSAPVASSGTAPSFASEGHPKAALNPGEETFEDIAARTGTTVVEILAKKMSFKKGIKAEKKVDEMVPMIKELR